MFDIGKNLVKDRYFLFGFLFYIKKVEVYDILRIYGILKFVLVL